MFWGIDSMVQTGFVVADLDSEMERWRGKGAGSFLVYREIDVPLRSHGVDVTLKLSVALSQFDGVQIELIQQHDRLRSAFIDTFPERWPVGDGGFHHIGMISADFDKTVAKLGHEGFSSTMSGEFGGYRFAYFDTRPKLGFFLEIFEDNGAMRNFFEKIKNP